MYLVAGLNSDYNISFVNTIYGIKELLPIGLLHLYVLGHNYSIGHFLFEIMMNGCALPGIFC